MSKLPIMDVYVGDPTKKAFLIPRSLFASMQETATLCNYEVSMLGLVELRSYGPTLTDLWVPPQVVGASHVEIDAAMIGDLQARLFHKGVIAVGDQRRFIRFAWHSHVDMDARMSEPDRDAFTALGGECTIYDPEWFISMVMNKSGAYQIIMDVFRPIRHVEDITRKTMIGGPVDNVIADEIALNVKLGKQTVIGGKPIK